MKQNTMIETQKINAPDEAEVIRMIQKLSPEQVMIALEYIKTLQNDKTE